MVDQQYVESPNPGQPSSTAAESIWKAPRANTTGVLKAMAVSTFQVGQLLLLSLSDIADFDAHANCPLQLIPSCTCKSA